MNELKRTGIYAGTAVILLCAAIAASRPAGHSAADFNDEGTKFFPNFTLPEQATALEVVEFDPSTGSARPFMVALKDGRWVIPSHYDYPADARERLATAAAGVLDLTKDSIRSDRPEDHKDLGVLDPLDPKVLGLEGLGKRLTLKDVSQNVLADLIIGKPVPGKPGQRFVRVPGQNRVYAVNMTNVDPSTRFSDWIETDLLKLSPTSLKSVVFDNDKVDVQGGRVLLAKGEKIIATREPGAPPAAPGAPALPAQWKLDSVPLGKEVNTTALDTLASTLANLKIVGVRPKPPGLTADLKSESGQIRTDQLSFQSLADRGFYITDRGLFSSEGNVFVTTDDGVLYLLHFGKVTFAQGDKLSAGGDDSEQEGQPAGSEGTPDDAIESRYLFVTTQFLPDSIEAPAEPEKDGELPADVFAKSASEREAFEKSRENTYNRLKSEYEARLKRGKEKSDEMKDRFAGWYYVVPGDSFRKVILDRAALTRDPGTAPPPAGRGMPGGMPGFPGGLPGGLPPGMVPGR